MILLDTNALVWVLAGHRRGRRLGRARGRWYVSPASVLELRFLDEIGRIRLRQASLNFGADPRLALDDPSSLALFEGACEIGWTRDPFDRLIVAHARLRRWRLATGDRRIIENLEAAETLEL